jgi:uncharacterized protein YndB with AHSA1/START domain
MAIIEKTILTVEAIVNADVEKVWDLWTNPMHILKWNNASAEWHTTYVENDLRAGGRFLYRMEGKDMVRGFDFSGEYTAVEPLKHIYFTLDDGRKVQVAFTPNGTKTLVKQIFEADNTQSAEIQQSGWQAIMDSFKTHVETFDLDLLHFEIVIDADAEKVYRLMIDEKSYAEWTHAFAAGSRFKGSWEKGSEIMFVAPSDGNVSGMISRIRENITGKFISIEHVGIVEDNKRNFSGEKVDQWAGGLENYTFTQYGAETLLKIDMHVRDDMKPYFLKTWPEALQKLKSICESR